MDIHNQGGGIEYTVEQVHKTPENELVKLMKQRLDRMLKFGTTLIEAKSGYGLDWNNELKMLRAIEKCKKSHPIDIVSTYLGAHSVQKGKTEDEATLDIIKNQIPELARLRNMGELSTEFVDIFHEKGIFEYKNTKNIMECAKKWGFKLNIHGDELHSNGSAELGTRFEAKAISHLEWITEKGIDLMSKNNTVAVLLPTTAHILNIDQPPCRKMLENNVTVALATDFNPNAFCMSMPFVMNLACITLKMTMNEALVASTLNAAASIDRSHTHGSLEIGKCGDFIVIDHPNWQHIIYEMASTPISAVYKNGKKVY